MYIYMYMYMYVCIYIYTYIQVEDGASQLVRLGVGFCGTSSQKVLYIVAVYSKYTRALTFENFWQGFTSRYLSSAATGKHSLVLKNKKILASVTFHSKYTRALTCEIFFFCSLTREFIGLIAAFLFLLSAYWFAELCIKARGWDSWFQGIGFVWVCVLQCIAFIRYIYIYRDFFAFFSFYMYIP